MNDESLRAAYGEHLSTRGQRRAGCVAPEALLAVADGSAREAERLQTLRHVGSCPACRADLDLLHSARDAAEAATVAPIWRRMPALAAAAVVLVLVGSLAVRQVTRGTTSDLSRDVATTTVPLLAPAENAAETVPVKLVWTAIPNARRYEIEIARPSGEAVYTTSTRDTTVTVPTGALVPGADYRWWVVAVLPERTRTSAARRLRIAIP